jgi:F0F1-type ATP synthase assembly protein I
MVDDAPAPVPDPEQPAEGPPAHDHPSPPGIADLLTMGLSSAMCLVAGGGIGYAIDDAVHSSPLWTLVGLGFGLVSGVMLMVSKVRKYL